MYKFLILTEIIFPGSDCAIDIESIWKLPGVTELEGSSFILIYLPRGTGADHGTDCWVHQMSKCVSEDKTLLHGWFCIMAGIS